MKYLLIAIPFIVVAFVGYCFFNMSKRTDNTTDKLEDSMREDNAEV
jgi:hypothetical protein